MTPFRQQRYRECIDHLEKWYASVPDARGVDNMGNPVVEPLPDPTTLDVLHVLNALVEMDCQDAYYLLFAAKGILGGSETT